VNEIVSPVMQEPPFSEQPLCDPLKETTAKPY
jgi:hypothetical protein